MDISVQMYSLKDFDFLENLKFLAEAGYCGVEFAGYHGIAAKDMKVILADLGLKAVGSHVGLETLRADIENEIEYNLEVGNKFIVCPHANMQTRDDTLRLAEEFNQFGDICKKNGAVFCYHNHAHEFAVSEGEYLLDILYANTDSALVKAEIDLYWVEYADVDCVKYIEKYADRLPLIHVKDIDAQKRNVTVGKGLIDFKTIMERHTDSVYIIEQEESETDIHSSLRQGLLNL